MISVIIPVYNSSQTLKECLDAILRSLEKLETEKEDIILDLDTGHLILDGMSVLYLAGMEVDYKKDLFGQRLMVENPNVKSMCGCGESFHVELH